jgi:hypothetical protein
MGFKKCSILLDTPFYEKGFSLMNIQRLYNKAITATNAIKFLSTYADDLNKIDEIKPIMANNALPSPKVSAICQVLWALLEKQQMAKKTIAEQEAVKVAAKANKSKEVETDKASYTVTIFVKGDSDTEVKVGYNDSGEELVKNLPTMQLAENWAENRLFDRYDALYAEIVAHKLVGKSGVITFKIDRQTALYNKLKIKPSPQCKRINYSDSFKLGFGMKVKNDRSYFSKG